MVKEKEKNENEKMWQVLLDVSVLSGVPGRRGIIGSTNTNGRTDIGTNIRQTVTEEKLNKSAARNWIITGARIVMGFI